MSGGGKWVGAAPPLPLLDAEVLNSVAPIYSIINSNSIINIKVIKHYIKLSVKDTTKKKIPWATLDRKYKTSTVSHVVGLLPALQEGTPKPFPAVWNYHRLKPLHVSNTFAAFLQRFCLFDVTNRAAVAKKTSVSERQSWESRPGRLSVISGPDTSGAAGHVWGPSGTAHSCKTFLVFLV